MSRSLVIVLALAVTTLAGQEPAVPVKVTAHWPMESVGGTFVQDHSGNGNHGSLIGEAAFVSDILPAVELSGPTGYIAVPHHDSLEPARGGVELWMKPGALKDVDVFYKLTFETLRSGLAGGKAVYGVHLRADGTLEGYILNDRSLPHWARLWTWVRSPRPLIKAGTWHHVVLQWDGRQVGLYVDGKKAASRAYQEIPEYGLSYSRESEFRLGSATRWLGTDDHCFVGRFRDVRVYHGTYTEEEIAERSGVTRPDISSPPFDKS